MKKEIKPYYHKVQYYETDGMAIVHHSNYIRWMEECRMDFLEQAGLSYEWLEEQGIMFPVLTVSCEYRMAVKFGERVRIDMSYDWFDGIRYGISYRIMSEDGKVLHAAGSTTHCFLNKDLKPIRVKKMYPDIYRAFCEYANELRGSALRAAQKEEKSN